jgi:hypothetical protein
MPNMRRGEQVRAHPARSLGSVGHAQGDDAVERGPGHPRDHAASETTWRGRKPRRSYFGRMRSIVARSILETIRSSPGP